MSQHELNRDKYLKIYRSEGLHSAITALHEEMRQIEFETFEGPDGYQPELFKKLEEFRRFSTELWDSRMDEPEGSKEV
jgi:hypothetical protein